MRHIILAALLAATAPAAFAAPVPKEQLLVPPKDAVHYVVVSEAGKHGDMWRWTLPDGQIAYRHSQSLRGWISETDQVVKLGPDGLPTTMEVRGITPSGDAAETLAIAGGKATWKSTADSGSLDARKPFYVAAGGVPLVERPACDALGGRETPASTSAERPCLAGARADADHPGAGRTEDGPARFRPRHPPVANTRLA